MEQSTSVYFFDNYNEKCRQQATHLKTKIVYIENESKLNSINFEGGYISSGILFLHTDFARDIDLKLAKNADFIIYCNNNYCKINTIIACQMAGRVTRDQSNPFTWIIWAP